MKAYLKILQCLSLYSIICCSASGQAVVNSKDNFEQKKKDSITSTILPLDPNVKVGKLSNGFTYYIRKNSEPANRATLSLVNKVGSVLETEEQRGLAHFLEHMCFNGTKHFPKNKLIEYLGEAGVRFGADLNAYTGFNETVYQLPIPLDKPGLLKNAMQILRDWAQDATLDEEEIDKERGVVLEERRLRLGAQQRIQDQLFPVIFNNSRYSNRLPIGTEEVLKNCSYESLRKFYKDWYRPNLQALIIVGDINIKAIEKMIIDKFSDLKNPQQELPRTEYSILLLNKNQFSAITDIEQPEMSIDVQFKNRAGSLITEDDYRKKIIQSVFNAMLTDRLNELGLQENMPFTELSGSISGIVADLDAFGMAVKPKPGETEKAFKALWTELERIKRFGFTTTELSRAKANMLSLMESAFKEKDKTPSDQFVKEYVQHFLKGDASPGIEFEYNLYKTSLERIFVEDVNHFFSHWYGDTNRDITITANEKDKASLPSEALINQWIKETGETNITAYIDNAIDNILMPVKPVAGKVASEKKIPEINATELALSNGIKVILKPTTFKKDEILFSASSPGGLSLVSDDKFYAANFTPLPVRFRSVNPLVKAAPAARSIDLAVLNYSLSVHAAPIHQ